MCIGNHFAMMEMILTIRRIFNNYNVELISEKIRLLPMVTLKPRDPIYVNISPKTSA